VTTPATPERPSQGAASSPGLGARETALIVALAVLAFAPALPGEFVLDDHGAILASPCVTEGLDLGRIFSRNLWCQDPAGGTSVDAWRPLTVLMWWLAWTVGGGAAWSFHALNVLLHGVASVLVARVGEALGLGRRAAWVTGLCFASLAIHADAVASSVGLAESLAAATGLSAIWFTLRGRPLAAVGFLTVALLAKESALGYAVAIAAWPWLAPTSNESTPPPRWLGLAAVALIPAVILARGVVLDTWTASHVTPWVNPLAAEPWSARLPAALALFGRYHWLTLAGTPLAADYSFAAIEVGDALELRWAAAGVAAAALWTALIVRGPSRRLAGWLALWMVASLAAVLHVVAPAPAIFAERFFYTPSAALLLAAALAIRGGSRTRGSQGRRPTRAVAVMIAAWLGWQTVAAARHAHAWASEDRITATTVVNQPRSARAHMWRARVLARAGDPAGMLPHTKAATDLVPGWANAWANHGAALDQLNRPGEAAAAFQTAMRIDPANGEVASLTVQFFVHRGRTDFAKQAYGMHAHARGGVVDPSVPRP
jgi:hypothetical protein